MRGALYRGYARLRTRPLMRHLREIEASQWLPRPRIEALQLDKLRAILAHAGRTVPYYRDVFRAARFDPAGVRGIGDLAALPVLDRETLTARFDDLRSEEAHRSARARATGGSTGRPLRFVVDDHEMTTRSAHIYRNLGWLGWRLGDRTAYVWGSDVDSTEHRGGWGRLRDRVAGVLWLDAFTLSAERMDRYLDRLEAFAPRVVIGYPSSLHLLATRALEKGRTIRVSGGIETSAEMLAPGVREDLEAAFGSRVFDRYGCREAGVVWHECSEGGRHLNAEAVVMETVGGEVLLTTLNNRAMPLVRYRNEDLAGAAGEACACRRGLPLAGPVRGRVSDVIRSPHGRLIHGEFFTHLFYGLPGVRQFQVEQTAPDRLVIRLVAGDDFTGAHRAAIESAVREHADAAFNIDWLPVSEIPPGPSGKFHFTISNIEKSASRHPLG